MKPKNLGIASFIASFFFPVAAAVAGVVSLVKGRKKKDKEHVGFALAGISISLINIVARVILGFYVFVSLLLFPLNGVQKVLPFNDVPNTDCNFSLTSYHSLSQEVACRVKGMDEQSALKYISSKGLPARVVARDDEVIIITADYSTSRVDIKVRQNIVYDAFIG